MAHDLMRRRIGQGYVLDIGAVLFLGQAKTEHEVRASRTENVRKYNKLQALGNTETSTIRHFTLCLSKYAKSMLKKLYVALRFEGEMVVFERQVNSGMVHGQAWFMNSEDINATVWPTATPIV